MKIKEIRKAKGISQIQAAKDLNLTQGTYNRYENGMRQLPNSLLLQMADYFGVTVDELLGRPSREEAEAAEDDDVMAIRELLRRDPNARELFGAIRKATPEHIRAVTATLKALEPEENE